VGQGAGSCPWDHRERGIWHAQDGPAEMTVDWGTMGVVGRTGSDGLLRVECEERLGGNLIGKGGGKIGWGETRSAPVAERV